MLSTRHNQLKVRKEISGLHFFNRITGLHILFDEIKFGTNEITLSPRVVSIALTNICDLKCHFCYAPKNKDTFSYSELQHLLKELDKLGVLEVTFGGGEPLIYPKFHKLCSWVWNNTKLGISFTTHGHLINKELVNKLIGNISNMRISIDGIEPRYSQIRGRPLHDLIYKINLINGSIPFGINCVITEGEVSQSEEVIKLAIELGAMNVLLIPCHNNGKYSFSLSDWEDLEQIITAYRNKIEILITNNAGSFVNLDLLQNSHENEFHFAHITANKRLQKTSIDNSGIEISNTEQLTNYFSQIYYL